MRQCLMRWSADTLVSLLSPARDNTAHGLYRSFGFVDGLLEQAFTKTLQQEPTKAVEGLVIRPYSRGDEVAMARVSNAFHEDQMESGRKRAVRQRTSETWLIYLAEKDGELLGYVQARCSEDGKSCLDIRILS